jgi:nucleotide-binding universal stress UspA family protein
MFQRILVALDGSERAERALPLAARLACCVGGTLLLVEVVRALAEFETGVISPATWAPAADPQERKRAADYLARVADSAVLAGITIESAVYAGPVAATLLLVAQARGADLLVLTTRGRTGLARWALGSVAEKVAHQAAVPALLLREAGLTPLEGAAAGAGAEAAAHQWRGLVPLDGSELAETALVPAAQLVSALATPGPAALHLVRVLEVVDLAAAADGLASSPGSGQEALESQAHEWALEQAKAYLRTLVERLRGEIAEPLQLSLTWSVVPHPQFGTYEADVASAIVRVAEMGEAVEGAGPPSRCDVIAMATHGRGGLAHWVLGSVTERVLHGSKLPMLIVHPPAATHHPRET